MIAAIGRTRWPVAAASVASLQEDVAFPLRVMSGSAETGANAGRHFALDSDF